MIRNTQTISCFKPFTIYMSLSTNKKKIQKIQKDFGGRFWEGGFSKNPLSPNHNYSPPSRALYILSLLPLLSEPSTLFLYYHSSMASKSHHLTSRCCAMVANNAIGLPRRPLTSVFSILVPITLDGNTWKEVFISKGSWVLMQP